MLILDHLQIKRKTRRLALEILESNLDAPEIYVGGINRNGQRFAQMLVEQIKNQSDLKIVDFHISLAPANPISRTVSYDLNPMILKDKNILIVDDVGNTGRTLFYACKPLMDVIPNRLEMAVLVDRMHKSFPVNVDYVGLRLATTLKNDIRVNLENQDELAAFLI